MKIVHMSILSGMLAAILFGAVGCGNLAHLSANGVTKKISTSAQTPSKIQFFVPQQLPPKTVLRAIKSASSYIELDYAPVGYDSMVPNTFWIQEVPNGHLSTTLRRPIHLISTIEGYYDKTISKQEESQKLVFIIPSSYTSKAPMLISIRSFNASTDFGKSQMINLARQIITNVEMTVGISR